MLNKFFKSFGKKEPHSRIVFERTGETISGLPKGIFTIKPDGSDCQQIRAKGESPKWSPDGRWIAFVEQTQDNGWLHSVFIMKPDGQNARRLTSHHDVTATPGAWSPDSKCLAYSLWLWQEKKYQLCIVEVETGRWKHVCYSDDEIYPVWSPLNKIVFRQFGKPGGHRLFEVNPDGQGFQPCPMFESGDDEPVWMWDGSRLVFGSNDGLVVMNGDGNGRRIIRSPQGALQWAMSPDGENVVYSSSRETSNAGFELFIVNLKDESKRKLVANPMKGNKEVDSRYVSWSPWL
jgi:Tol biopolymer transport system component